MSHKPGSLFVGTLLVAGTSIGGGVLALPILTGLGGFLPSMVIYLLCWAFMATTGLLFLELCFWMERDSNIVTMAVTTLGRWGRVVAWLIYLFLFYSLTIAYVDGCGDMICEFFHGTIPEWLGALIFLAATVPMVFIGPRLVGPFNTLMMVGLGITFFTFVLYGAPHVNPELLERSEWKLSLIGLPVAFTSFGFQGIVPTLARYMGYRVKQIRLAILIGSFLPLVAYIIWQWLILGIVPVEGPDGIAETLAKGKNAIYPLKLYIDIPKVYVIGKCFAFFALITSFFGVTLGLFDFLADGLHIKKNFSGRCILSALVFVPPFIIASSYPNLFLRAIDLAGGFGVALLLGLLPVLMVWSGRYHKGFTSSYQVWGGKPLLLLLIAFVVFEVVIELGGLMGWGL